MSVIKDLFQGITPQKRKELERIRQDIYQEKEAFRVKLYNSEFANLLVNKIFDFIISPAGQSCVLGCRGISLTVYDDQIEHIEYSYSASEGPDHHHSYNYQDMGYKNLTEYIELPIFVDYIKTQLAVRLDSSYAVSTPTEKWVEVYRLWDKARNKGHRVKKISYNFRVTKTSQKSIEVNSSPLKEW